MQAPWDLATHPKQPETCYVEMTKTIQIRAKKIGHNDKEYLVAYLAKDKRCLTVFCEHL
jgi:hypothetical protein